MTVFRKPERRRPLGRKRRSWDDTIFILYISSFI
jgi:hypothetical protein